MKFLSHIKHSHLPLTSLVLALVCSLASAQGVDKQDIADQRSVVSADSTLTEESRTDLLVQLDEAQGHIEAAGRFQKQTREFRATMDHAQDKADEFEQQLQNGQTNGQEAIEIAQDISADQIESQIRLVIAERQALTERRSFLLRDIDELPARRATIKKRLVTLQSQAEPTELNPRESSPEQVVGQILAEARAQAANAEKESLETETLSESARSRISAAERAWLGFAIEAVEAKLAALNDALERARSSATEEQLQTTAQLRERLQTEDPMMQSFADGNRSLAEQLRQVASKSDTARREGLLLQTLVQNIAQDSALMRRRLDVAGRKEVLGRVMITRMNSLPDTDQIKRGVTRRDELIASTSLAQIDIEEDFRAINERQDYLARLAPDLKNWNDSTRALVNDLVDQRVQLLENNLKSQASLLQLLVDNNDKAAELITATDGFHQFLLGNLLWVRNFSFLDMGTMTEQLTIVLSPYQWAQLPRQLVSGYQRESWSPVLLLALLASMLLRRRLRPVYERLLSRPLLLSGATLWHIVGGLFLSLLLVVPWPLLLLILGHFLHAAENATRFNDALAPALSFSSRVLYVLLLIRLIASRMGVGRRFLKWDARMLDSVRNELNWAGPVFCLAFVVDVFAFYLDVVASGGPLGAVATAVIAGSAIAMALRLQKEENFAEHALLRLLLRLVAAIGMAVITMQLLGLLFAAEIYLMALARSVVVLLLIKLVADIFERWLLILRARLERQVQVDDHSEEEEDGVIDVISLSEAHAKLLTLARFVAAAAALFAIWAPSLPALNLLDSITLWEVADTSTTNGLRAITLFDLTYSAIILVITGLLTKHLPSLSEVFMREWFNMSAGARYASSILMQYVVIAIGGSMFLTTIGWEWGKVQWLVAAMGVGIGFGLQEIVANFISGIIILFERPVRVGDIISAGGAEGTVKKINPRATIIETFDRKEHLIPNKELITGQVINWTLSDGAVRVIIPVGIAYGSDVREALSLLLEAAGEVDTVLQEPVPRASFEDFGDNALLLWLRCYVSDDRVGTWTALRTIINDKFNAAGIEISFPQRDVHLDTLEPLQIEIKGA